MKKYRQKEKTVHDAFFPLKGRLMQKRRRIKVLLFVYMVFGFVVSTALTVPPVPSEAHEVTETKISVVNLGLPIIFFLNFPNRV